ncbi:MAG: hypothetical protein ACTHOR_19960 [Devosia sp.]
MTLEVKRKSNWGGKRRGAGRKPGSRTRANRTETMSLAEAARSHSPVALQTLVDICQRGESEAARVSAANALLDRGYGRPKDHVELTGKDGAAVAVRTELPADQATAYEVARRIAWLLARDREQVIEGKVTLPTSRAQGGP